MNNAHQIQYRKLKKLMTIISMIIIVLACTQIGNADTIQPNANGLWSNEAIWPNNTLPSLADDVIIPQGRNVTLNGSVRAKSITIHGVLRAGLTESMWINLETEYILVNGTNARFEIGTEDSPYIAECIITLIGADDGDNIMGSMGDKFIAAMNNGKIEFHGKFKHSWTNLGANALSGTNQITLSTAVNWEVGDQLIITSSTTNWNQAEKVGIVEVATDGKAITLDRALQHRHTGVVKEYTRAQDSKTWSADIRAEVGLLSHNITIQGDAGSEAAGFGGHIMVHGTGVAHIENVELFRMGQKSKLGRYPFHWHMLGNTGQGQYFKNSSVHHSFNRAITIHGTESTLVQRNVLYDHIGHGVFLEDGSERFNTIIGNVVLLSKRPVVGEEVTPSDNQFNQVQNRTPASFWITNPNNYFQNNVAAGTHGTGFWFAFPTSPMGESATDPRFTGLEPHKQPLGKFKNNKAHSCMSGFDIFDQLSADHAILPNRGWPNSSQHIMDECTWYANALGVYAGIGDYNFQENVIYRDNIFVDNKLHVMLATYNHIENSVFVANSGEGGVQGMRHLYRAYDGAGRIDNCHFVGWNAPNTSLLFNGGAAVKHTNHLFSNITTNHADPLRIEINDAIADTPTSLHANHPFHPRTWSLAIRDVDNSLTGKANTTIVNNHPFQLVGNEFQHANWENAYRSDHRFVVSILTYPGLAIANFPNVTAKRFKSGTPKAGVYYVNGFKEHHQLPFIVNDDFLYTYEYESLPTNKVVAMHMQDATVGDYYLARFRHFGKLGGLSITSLVGNITAYNSLTALKQANQSGYYIQPNGDLYLRPVATTDRMLFTVQWTNSIALSPVDTDGDGTSDGKEATACRDIMHAKDLQHTFNVPNDYEAWTGSNNVTNLRVENGSLKGTSSATVGDAMVINTAYNFAAQQVPKIYVWMKASSNTGVQIFWKRLNDAGFLAERVSTDQYTGNGKWQKLVFNVNNNSNWTGTIDQLRIDPVSGTNISFEIGEIISTDDSDGDTISDLEELNLCFNPNDANDLHFDFYHSQEGFEQYHITAQNTVNSVYWLLRADYNNDPQITRKGLLLDGNDIPIIKVRARSQATGTFQIFWKTIQDNSFSADRVKTVNYTTLNQWKEMSFNMTNHPLWKDQVITDIRLDFPVNVNAKVHTYLDYIRGTSTHFQTNGRPVGDVDAENGDNISGWAFDPSNSTASMSLQLEVLDPLSNQLLGTHNITADLPSASSNALMGVTGNHGFSFNLRDQYCGKLILVNVIGLSSGCDALDAVIKGSGKEYNFTDNNGRPKGAISTDTQTLKGWAFDQSDPSVSINLHAYVYDATTNALLDIHVILANLPRADVNSFFGITGQHGFSMELKGLYCGKQIRVNLYGINVGCGANTLLNPTPKEFDYTSTDYMFAGSGGLTGLVTGTAVYQATGVIESTQQIGGSANVDYNSGQEIYLLPSFEILQGAQFHAFIEGCNN